MGSCKNCRHLINILDDERITCEAHKKSLDNSVVSDSRQPSQRVSMDD